MILIRPLSPENVNAVYDIGMQCEGTLCHEGGQFWSKEQLTRWFLSTNDVCIGAFNPNNELMGFNLVAVHHPTKKATWENQIVVPQYRNQGIAKKLDDVMMEKLSKLGVLYLHFLIKTSNDSFSHYEKIGCVKGDTFVWYGKFLT